MVVVHDTRIYLSSHEMASHLSHPAYLLIQKQILEGLKQLQVRHVRVPHPEEVTNQGTHVLGQHEPRGPNEYPAEGLYRSALHCLSHPQTHLNRSSAQGGEQSRLIHGKSL